VEVLSDSEVVRLDWAEVRSGMVEVEESGREWP
jgi:hypothetical protein